MREIKLCPFCGSGKTGLVNSFVKDASFVECDNCNAQGPWMVLGDEEDAIEAWNKRV